MKQVILMLFALCACGYVNGQDQVQLESSSADVLSLNSTGSDATVINFLNSNAALTGGSNKRAYISTNGNVLNLGLSNNNTGGRIEFYGQGLKRLTMNADGRFGIGSISPTQKLDVDGQVRIRNLPSAASTDSYVTADASGNLRIKSSSTPSYAVGDFAQGGVIFWLSPDGRHGKVVSIHNIENVNQWSNITNIAVGHSARSLTNGAGNTAAIINQPGHETSAAQICSDFVYGGYNDWYLPAKNECDLVFSHQMTIDATALINGGDILLSLLWTSTELNFTDARVSSSGVFSSNQKSSTSNALRPIRAFSLD